MWYICSEDDLCARDVSMRKFDQLYGEAKAINCVLRKNLTWLVWANTVYGGRRHGGHAAAPGTRRVFSLADAGAPGFGKVTHVLSVLEGLWQLLVVRLGQRDHHNRRHA